MVTRSGATAMGEGRRDTVADSIDRGIELDPAGRPASAIVTLTLALLGVMLLGMAGKDGVVCGVHTMRADDAALSLIREAGCSFVLRLFHCSRIEPL